jgi:hypothetical protein
MGKEDLYLMFVEYCELKNVIEPDDWYSVWLVVSNEVPDPRTLYEIFDAMFGVSSPRHSGFHP